MFLLETSTSTHYIIFRNKHKPHIRVDDTEIICGKCRLQLGRIHLVSSGHPLLHRHVAMPWSLVECHCLIGRCAPFGHHAAMNDNFNSMLLTQRCKKFDRLIPSMH